MSDNPLNLVTLVKEFGLPVALVIVLLATLLGLLWHQTRKVDKLGKRLDEQAAVTTTKLLEQAKEHRDDMRGVLKANTEAIVQNAEVLKTVKSQQEITHTVFRQLCRRDLPCLEGIEQGR